MTNFSGNNYFASGIYLPDHEDYGGRGIVTNIHSTLHFYGRTSFINNLSKFGGAIFAAYGKVYVHHKAIIANNVAINGGGIFLYQSELYCVLNCTLLRNHALQRGGAIHAVSSKIVADVEFFAENQIRYILFSNNRARLGGALSLEQNSKLSLINSGVGSKYGVTFLRNTADYGGAVYINDSSSTLCDSKYFIKHRKQRECFLLANVEESGQAVIFSENLAKVSGSSIFGGLLDI